MHLAYISGSIDHQSQYVFDIKSIRILYSPRTVLQHLAIKYKALNCSILIYEKFIDKYAYFKCQLKRALSVYLLNRFITAKSNLGPPHGKCSFEEAANATKHYDKGLVTVANS